MKLVYTSDRMPGYRRVRRGKGFCYMTPEGSTLADKLERERIISLAIPPAYEDVWVCLIGNGHLQATGLDARRRKQYRYHPAWHEQAAEKKFEILRDFVGALPAIRAAIRRELGRNELTRERVIAGIVALLDLTGYRIGNSRYAKENKTFGLSSLLIRHLNEDHGRFRLKFRGKSGHQHLTEITDPRIGRLISELQELPGQHLFCYEDDDGIPHEIGTAAVNDWVKDVSGGEYTAKQFRTWRATLTCARELGRKPPAETAKERDRVIREAIKVTAGLLNHTPTTCRKYYLHPNIITSFVSGELFKVMSSAAPKLNRTAGSHLLRADERRVFTFLT